ncbi:MAG: methyltransferase family protein [Moorellaceae bacterium]
MLRFYRNWIFFTVYFVYSLWIANLYPWIGIITILAIFLCLLLLMLLRIQKPKQKDPPECLIIGFGPIILFGLFLLYVGLSGHAISRPLYPFRYIWGLFVFISLFSFHLWVQATSQLGKNFVDGIATPEKLITHGPYTLVRHPVYLAYNLLYPVVFLGAALLIKNNLILPFSFLASLTSNISFYWRAKMEEDYLNKVLSDTYYLYCRQTPMLFPTKLSLVRYLKEPVKHS